MQAAAAVTPSSASDTGAEAPAPNAAAELTLLEAAPGVAVLLADTVPDGWEIEAFNLGKRANTEITDAFSNVAGALNLVAQGAQGLVSAQGLVRLAPETLRNLRTMNMIVKDGYNLGVLTRGGKFAAQVRWVPATGVQAATVAASAGPAFALMAISAQLTSLSKRVDQNLELTRDVLQTLLRDHWNALSGMYDTVVGAIDEVREIGAVTPRVFEPIAHLESDLRAEYKHFDGRLQSHLKALGGTAAERRDYLRDHAQEIAADLQGLVMSANAHYGYQLLAAAEIASDSERSEQDEQLMRYRAERIPAERAETMARIAQVLGRLDAYCHLAELTDGHGADLARVGARVGELAGQVSGRVPALRRARRGASTEQIVAAMTQYVAALCVGAYEAPAALEPNLKVIEDDDAVAHVLDILRWVLPNGESLIALVGFANASVGDIGLKGGYLGVTPTRFFLASRGALARDGLIEHDFPLADVRYVRYRQGGGRPRLDIITKDENLAAHFADWAASGDPGERLRRVADVLMTAVNLPAEERRSDPLLEATAALPS
ncbi:hypothetical protein SAMN05216355_10757 [Actinomyces ruminicola]|uniref:Uncharacterized protein n=1 Tax=Actinomyces ruminicola TaxID=332524 RepID=A0A1H0CKR2_9ACTO|nr:hypothetical protein [Actinomyces ruminicola]SDN58381.1 hypothetical protein SAMN05216355_10757 [Actinomyces ruminicola]